MARCDPLTCASGLCLSRRHNSATPEMTQHAMLATTRYRIASIVVMFAIATCINVSVAEELRVLYRNDSEVTANLPGGSIDWVTVSENGSLIERKIELREIQSLTLSRGKSSELLAQIRQSISRLSDVDFVVREKAEMELELRGGPFKFLIERLADSPSMEVRYRAGRLLKVLSKRNDPRLALDTLVLKNGRTLEGEAREFSLTGEYRDAPISLDRKLVAQLLQKKPITNEPGQPQDKQGDGVASSTDREPVKTEIFHKHTDFINPDQSEFKFEVDANGEAFLNRARVDAAFADNGLLFRNEQTGYVGISVFSFKYDDLPVGGRSVCLYGQGSSRRQFQGFLEIRFCVPGKPNMPAGVKELGLFVARVNHSRDIVMEAYGAHGNVLATVEATDQQCVFAGVKSNELITRVRIFSNPWLEKLSRRIDVDFAIDTLRISAPIAVQSVVASPRQHSRVELDNGDRFSGSFNTAGDGNLLAHVSGVSERPVKFTFKQDELASIHLNSNPVVNSPLWKAMLDDGSIVGVSPGKRMTSELLNDKFSLDDMVAFWKGSSPARYPIDGDWKSGQALVVFPTCRIQSDPFSLSDRGVSWTVKNKLEQMLMLGREDPDAQENQEDPTPSETSVTYGDIKSVQQPTFWNRQPQTNPHGRFTGVVELSDGQRFLFGKGKLFQFAGLKNREIRLTWMEANPVNIPLNRVRTIIFPKQL